MLEMSRWLLICGLLGQAALLGANAFEAVVDVPNWRSAKGLTAYRAFISTRHAGHFYRVLSPATILLLVLALGASALAGSGLDPRIALALTAAVVAEVFTVAYFFPKNRRLFFEEPPVESEAQSLVAAWSKANWVRIGIVTVGALCGFAALSQPSS